MRVLLTNDDGIYAPGLAAMERALRREADVTVASPQVEQSGVGHSITFLKPLVCHEIYEREPDGTERRRGWSVEGSPADCVKLTVAELLDQRPDLVVSGINSGLNAGINVLYSGTVAAAIEGAFFGIPSVAVSLEYDEHARYDAAAAIAMQVLRPLFWRKPMYGGLVNLNIPLAALSGQPKVQVVPMGVARYGDAFIKRTDPRGRTYYWASNDPPPQPTEQETDLTALFKGFVTLTPLRFDLTNTPRLDELAAFAWDLEAGPSNGSA